jgi:hypothetical protein
MFGDPSPHPSGGLGIDGQPELLFTESIAAFNGQAVPPRTPLG